MRAAAILIGALLTLGGLFVALFPPYICTTIGGSPLASCLSQLDSGKTIASALAVVVGVAVWIRGGR